MFNDSGMRTMKFPVAATRGWPVLLGLMMPGSGIAPLRAQDNTIPPPAEVRLPYLNPDLPVEKRVADLLGRMTLEEKIALVHADSKFSTAAIPRLGIPRRWIDDGPHGVREDVGPYSWTPAGRTDDYATWLPALSALGSTWNVDLAAAFGDVLGQEARARNKDIILAPIVDIARTPICGRIYEYFGEDPFLTTRMAVKYIAAVQSNDVAACVKHFAGNNQEDGRGIINIDMDDRTLREIYLPPFEAAVKEAHVWAVMGAYPKFRGEYCAYSDYLVNKILKGEWRFPGLVMSDWSGTHSLREAALGGLDVEMGTLVGSEEKWAYTNFFLATPFLDAIRTNAIPAPVLDDKASRSLRVMFATHVFDSTRLPGSLNTPAHHAVARRVAEESVVLLKNRDHALPLDASKIKSVAVIGENAVRHNADGFFGAGVKTMYQVTPLQGIEDLAGARVNITYSAGYSKDATNNDLAERAVAAASQADVAIVVAGLNHSRYLDDEGWDRKDLRLPYGQDELIGRIARTNRHTIVVLVSGPAIEMDPWLDRVPAVLQAHYSGMDGGHALARILFGEANPSGKLTVTYPKTLTESPAHALGTYPGTNGTLFYTEGLLVGYRWYDTKDIEPEFPFGFGLSYTTFEYSNLQLVPGGTNGSVVTAKFDIANTGSRAGAEVAELYLHQDRPSLPRPIKELKGFTKVLLKPGEKRTVAIPLDQRAFAFYDASKASWVAEADNFEILVGSSSRDIRLRDTFHLAQTTVER